MTKEHDKFYDQDKQVANDALTWLRHFWWNNRQPPNSREYDRDKSQAEWETDRLIHALLNLKT